MYWILSCLQAEPQIFKNHEPAIHFINEASCSIWDCWPFNTKNTSSVNDELKLKRYLKGFIRILKRLAIFSSHAGRRSKSCLSQRYIEKIIIINGQEGLLPIAPKDKIWPQDRNRKNRVHGSTDTILNSRLPHQWESLRFFLPFKNNFFFSLFEDFKSLISTFLGCSYESWGYF